MSSKISPDENHCQGLFLLTIPLVIIAFRKKDGGISVCSKKGVPKSERFFDNRYKIGVLPEAFVCEGVSSICILTSQERYFATCLNSHTCKFSQFSLFCADFLDWKLGNLNSWRTYLWNPNPNRVDKLLNNRISKSYQSLLLANAFAEWDLRYFSNAKAFDLSLKER